ncbi:MAG: hypothetical protein R2707_14435 [Acidimicrobiales bacterium]
MSVDEPVRLRLHRRLSDAGTKRIDPQIHNFSGEMALLEGLLPVRCAETTGMIVIAMMTRIVGVVAVLATTLA